MDDLISRDALLAAYDAAHKGPPGGARKLIQDAPSVDAEPVKRGRWTERYHAYNDEEAQIEEWQSAKCSVCGKYHTTPYMYYFTDYNFCPHCGADLREVEKDDYKGR